jgi:hypothetical protein
VDLTRTCLECAPKLPRNLYLLFFFWLVLSVVVIILVSAFVLFPDRVTLLAWLFSLSSMNAYMLDE